MIVPPRAVWATVGYTAKVNKHTKLDRATRILDLMSGNFILSLAHTLIYRATLPLPLPHHGETYSYSYSSHIASSCLYNRDFGAREDPPELQKPIGPYRTSNSDCLLPTWTLEVHEREGETR